MAASAAFFRLHRTELKDLADTVAGDEPQELMDFLMTNGSSVVDYDGDADIFSVLLPILAEDYDIDLETSENGLVADLAEASTALVFILTAEERLKYLERLAPDRFSAEDLADAYEDFTEDEEDEDDDVGEAMLSSIGALHQALQDVDDDHVVVVAIS